MDRAILIRYGELFLKGKNKNYFEKTLISNIKHNLKNYAYSFNRTAGRYYLVDYDIKLESEIIDNLKKVFGLHSVSPCAMLDTSIENITDYIKNIKLKGDTFRITVNRADKNFPIQSAKFSADMGKVVLDNNPKIKVNLTNYDTNINIDIRENKKTFVFYENIPCAKGMPVGTSGSGLLLLSGGIDSPVAGYEMAKRGMRICALHFHSYPYTSELAKQKVIKLAQIVSEYSGKIRLFVCSFTKIQEEIHKCCNEEYMITIMRRIMMRIAEKVCENNNLQCIITGESLGQVASQTIESMTVTGGVVNNLQILRPLVSCDKEEITIVAKNINTFETSILPYEDCCTVFLPKHPLIKPVLAKVEKEESKLDIEKLIENAMQNIEIIDIK